MTDAEARHTSTDNKVMPYARAIIKLLQGVLYPDDNGWDTLRTYLLEVQGYFAQIGLHLEYIEGEYAFLRQPRIDRANEDDDRAEALPRLIRSHALSYNATLICVLLRERLIEHESQQDQGLPTMTREEFYERMTPFMKERGSQSLVRGKINAAISEAVDLGFIKEIKDKETFQIRGIVKARITAEMLAEVRTRLIDQLEITPDESDQHDE